MTRNHDINRGTCVSVRPALFVALLAMSLVEPAVAAGATPAFVPIERTEPGRRGEFLLNGKPFLPLVLTMLENNGSGTLDEKLARAEAANFNCVQVSDSLAGLRVKLDLLRKHHLYGRVALFGGFMDNLMAGKGDVAELVRALRNHPALLGWELQDELNSDPARYPPTQVRAAYQYLRTLDPNHAVWLNLMQFGPDGAESWNKWAGCADVMSNDNYPFSRGGELAAYFAALNWVVRSRPGVAATYLQLSQLHPEVGPPTAANLRMLGYLALLRGHRALSYYGYAEGSLETWRDYPLLWQAASDLNAELTQALPLLLSPECRAIITPKLEGDWRGLSWAGETCDPLQLVVRQIDEHCIACFVLGLPSYEAGATFHLDPAVPLRSVTLWPKGEAVVVSDNGWSDRVHRGQVKVYLLHT